MFLCGIVALVAALGCAAFGGDPRPDPDAVVVAGNARFTVLTPDVIRMEWGHVLRDEATLIFTHRRVNVPKYVVAHDAAGWLTITTERIMLRYDASNPNSFNDANIKVTVLDTGGPNVTWTPSQGDRDGRLPGTLRTLDMTNGSVNLDCDTGGPDYIADSHCTYGVMSRRGFIVIDDSLGYELSAAPWPWVVPKAAVGPPDRCDAIPHKGRRVCGSNLSSKEQCDAEAPLPHGFVCYYGPSSYQDLYFFGHGRRFKDALRDFALLSGQAPLPPRYAFGVFYSRWWAYSDDEVETLVQEFASRAVPLDIVVLDMDWHLTFYKNSSLDQADQPKGWTGYTWNTELFPSPTQFLRRLHDRGLRVTLNLHPASGVQPWESSYVAVARAVGIDPSSQRYVPFDLTNKTYASAWLSLSLAPLEAEGVDFWWLDWQQGEDWFVAHDQALASLSPTLWLNHVFFTNPLHWGTTPARPLILHRFGGLGSHRYPVGFSGDVEASWASLAFQPQFTAAAANVAFGYWSHDIGGFLHGADPELYTRWVQWGVFSPIFRSHSTKDARIDRRIWKFPSSHCAIMQRYMTLRLELVPYIYTAARHAFDTGLSLLHGLYLEWPELDAAYLQPHQYLFGPMYMVAPIVAPLNASTQLITCSVWIPPGIWFDETFGALLQGPSTYSAKFTLDDVPRFLKAGSIVPMAPSLEGSSLGQAQLLPSTLRLVIVPGTSTGGGTLYEDAGDSVAYDSAHEFATTQFTYESSPLGTVVVVEPVRGSFPSIPTSRKYEVILRHVPPASSVAVNGAPLHPVTNPAAEGWYYDASTLSLHVYLPTARAVSSTLSITVHFAKEMTRVDLNNAVGIFSRLHTVKRLLDEAHVFMEDYPTLLHAAATDHRISYNTSIFLDEIDALHDRLRQGISEVHALAIPTSLKSRLEALLEVPNASFAKTTSDRYDALQ
ncbi:glycoside hydrolase [Achlya hypogyna]|uniref:Glycoside hydrolase n=1 Tax=Achlya hypogyna TaxID=1202772 RepID=A0A1V9YUD0_ACHHY|nr:glycoside hydrolase [Achlya hypogyna]